MIGYRCKCGAMQAWGSDPPPKCSWCVKCQSSYAAGPQGHYDRVAHDFSNVQKLATDQGPATMTRCRYCYRTAAEVTAEGQS